MPRIHRALGAWFFGVLFLAAGVAQFTHFSAVHAASPQQPGFQDTVALSGLTNPTVVRFAPDGRIFVAEKSGIIRVFQNLSDTNPVVVADLSTNVYNFWDRGLLGMALDPNFSTNHTIYVLYAYDAAIGGTAPRWGTPGQLSDPCPTPPGANTDGCVISGRLSKIQLSGNTMTGGEQVLINDWCQQFPSHSIGSLEFGPDGALYASAGEGANFNADDYGQFGNPTNPCGDPQNEGGSLRSQDLQTAGDPTTLDGAILRLDPATGAAMPDNPLINSTDLNARRIISEGLRNPFRFTIRPGTNEVWIGDVGSGTWEEINRIQTPTVSTNFGWPCFEGPDKYSSYPGSSICTNLYAQNTAMAPYYTYNHSAQIVPGEACQAGSSSISGLAFNPGGNFPAKYDGALFFADYSRGCIWAMLKGQNGLPDPNQIETIDTGSSAVNLVFGPDNALYYPDLNNGVVRRISSTSATPPPPSGNFTAQYWNTPNAGTAPTFPTTAPTLTRTEASINYDWMQGSPDPSINVDHFMARWTETQNLAAGTYRFTVTADDGVRVYVDNALVIDGWVDQYNTTYTADKALTAGNHDIKVEYYENTGGAVAQFSFANIAPPPPTNQPPAPVISTPASSLTWKVGDTINFSGSATDPEDGALAPAQLTWTLIMHHCPSNCHLHTIQSFAGVSSGSFATPDHEYPSYLELQLTATDSAGLASSTSVILQPKTVDLTFGSNPSGLQLTAGTFSKAAPFTQTFIQNSQVALNTISPQMLSGQSYNFQSWSDGGAQGHTILSTATPTTYTATFTANSSSGYLGQYWNTPNAGTAPTIPTTAPTLTRNDAAINFDWGTGSPDPSITIEHFVARWTKTTSFTAGTYTFTATADDGIRVYIDGALLIDKWIDQGPTTYTATKTLTAGNHDIKVEYYENTGGAVAKVSYSGSAAPQPTTTISANPTNIKVGSSTRITWSSTNATSCVGTNFSTANAVSGAVTQSPTATTTYSVNCTGAGGSKSASVTVGVTQKPAQGQVILTPTSGGFIKDAQGNTWTLTSGGNIMKNGIAVPGGGGTSALTYTSASQKIWGQDSGSRQWYYWDGANWIGPSATYQ